MSIPPNMPTPAWIVYASTGVIQSGTATYYPELAEGYAYFKIQGGEAETLREFGSEIFLSEDEAIAAEEKNLKLKIKTAEKLLLQFQKRYGLVPF